MQPVAPAGRKTSKSASELIKYRQACAARSVAGNYRDGPHDAAGYGRHVVNEGGRFLTAAVELG